MPACPGRPPRNPGGSAEQEADRDVHGLRDVLGGRATSHPLDEGRQPHVTDDLRDRDVVFDNSGGGEFYHAYVEPFEGRFFFEIVQRVAYDGYGAVNAPARLASVAQGEGVRI